MLAACGGDDGPSGPTVSMTFTNLPTLGTGFVYEAWVMVDGQPVSAGTFSSRANYSAGFIADDAAAATAVLVSIEPAQDMDPAPSNTKILGADLTDGQGSLTIAHEMALGDDYTGAKGSFVLATPTTNITTDENQGIWFTNASPLGVPSSGLMLPPVPDGWTYEGWVIDTSTNPPTPHSTGKFINGDPTMGDDDNAGDAKGTENLEKTQRWAGQDYIDPARDLSTNHQAAITIEPVPDDDRDKPFALKPLANTITMITASEGTQPLSNTIGQSSITGTATVQ